MYAMFFPDFEQPAFNDSVDKKRKKEKKYLQPATTTTSQNL